GTKTVRLKSPPIAIFPALRPPAPAPTPLAGERPCRAPCGPANAHRTAERPSMKSPPTIHRPRPEQVGDNPHPPARQESLESPSPLETGTVVKKMGPSWYFLARALPTPAFPRSFRPGFRLGGAAAQHTKGGDRRARQHRQRPSRKFSPNFPRITTGTTGLAGTTVLNHFTSWDYPSPPARLGADLIRVQTGTGRILIDVS